MIDICAAWVYNFLNFKTKGVNHLTALQSIRTEKAMTVSELARLANVSRQTIYKIESGEGDVSTKTLKALADTLGVPVSAFFVE